MSKIGELDTQIESINEMMTSAANIGDVETIAQLQKEKAEVQKQKGEEVASGVGGTVGAVAGGALGAAIAGPIGAMIGSQLGQMIGTTFGPAIGKWWNSTAWPALQGLWKNLSSAFLAVPQAIRGFFTQTIPKVFNDVVNKISGAFAKFDAMFGGLPGKILGALQTVFTPWTTILSLIKAGIERMAGFLGNLKWPSWLGGNDDKDKKPKPPKPTTRPTPGTTGNLGPGPRSNTGGARGGRAYDGKGSRKMPLGSAISSEMRNKPAGSHLVIANSSETVIPAAGGYGTKELFATLQQGFANTKTTFERISQGVNINRQDMVAGFKQSEQKDTERANATNGRIDKYQQTTLSRITGISQNVAALAAQVKQMSSFGAMGGGIAGGAGGGGGMGTGSGYGSGGSKIAGALGTYIKQTGGAPGSIHEHPQHGGVKGKHSPNSYHYQGRAIDIGAYANEQAGVMARIAQFNAKNNVKPVEWLHAKNAGGHNDHVHVAYAFGQGNPALFSSKQAAQKFEKSMVPSSVRVGSITGNSAEGFGGSTTVNNNITIQQQPGQNAEDLAMIVAQKIGEAVADARAASILV
jgi:hypothetical protein